MIGLYGGSFDPIHNGHLRAALESCERLQLTQLYFTPCFQHPLGKSVKTTSEHRLTMLQLAIQHCPLFSIEQRELEQQTISYSIDTLIAFNKQHPDEKIALIIGTDVFLEFFQWHRWQEILTYAHIIVLQRPGYLLTPQGKLKTYLEQHQCHAIDQLVDSPQHKIAILELPLLEISSTYIRQQIIGGLSPQYLLPYSVNQYILANNVYCLDNF